MDGQSGVKQLLQVSVSPCIHMGCVMSPIDYVVDLVVYIPCG